MAPAQSTEQDSLAQLRIVSLRGRPARTAAEAEELALLEEYVLWVNGPGRERFAALQEKERARQSGDLMQRESAPKVKGAT